MIRSGWLAFAVWLSTLSAPDGIHLEPLSPQVVQHMREVHARFQGEKGTLALFGDSISVSLAFWAPLAYECRNVPPEMEEALKTVRTYIKPECWRNWRGPEFGNEGGRTVRWAYENVDRWLARLQPETVILMFGTNDLHQLEEEEYREKLRTVIQRCLEHGTVVILTTIPPRHGFEAKSARFAQVARELAQELQIPLIDFHAAIVQLRPDDWDGALDQFRQYDGYEVPTLIARDGVHPSNPQRYMGDFSQEALRCSGYTLRNYLTALRYAEVIRKILRPRE